MFEISQHQSQLYMYNREKGVLLKISNIPHWGHFTTLLFTRLKRSRWPQLTIADLKVTKHKTCCFIWL